MKTFLCIFIFVVSVIAIQATRNYLNSKQLSKLTMENIEALSLGEENGESEASTICYVYVECEEDASRMSTTWYCGDCTEIPYTHRNDQLVCKKPKK